MSNQREVHLAKLALELEGRDFAMKQMAAGVLCAGPDWTHFVRCSLRVN